MHEHERRVKVKLVEAIAERPCVHKDFVHDGSIGIR